MSATISYKDAVLVGPPCYKRCGLSRLDLPGRSYLAFITAWKVVERLEDRRIAPEEGGLAINVTSNLAESYVKDVRE